MALMGWSSEYSVAVESLDKQHAKLFDMVNELHEGMKVGQGNKLAPAILTKLVQYTRQHFADEERMMVQARYPDFARHKAEHDKLTNQVEKLVRDFQAGKVQLSVQLSDFLRDWLKSHICGADKLYSNAMRAAGLR